MPKVKTNSFYPRKVVKQGGARTISVGKILPPDWLMVKISVVEKTEGSVYLRLEKIM